MLRRHETLFEFSRWAERVALGVHHALRIALHRAVCIECGVAVPKNSVLCTVCAHTVDRAPTPLAVTPAGREVWAPFIYGGALRSAIHRFKFGARGDLAAPLGALLVPTLQLALDEVGHPDLPPLVLTAVPSRPAQLRARGYNPAALLLRSAAPYLEPRRKLEVVYGLLAARDGQGAQHMASREARLARRWVAFETSHVRPPLRVVLVDDVVTTGATLAAASETLRAAGHACVACVTLARTPSQASDFTKTTNEGENFAQLGQVRL
jgi:predicted amidophosphoribosyltransferase